MFKEQMNKIKSLVLSKTSKNEGEEKSSKRKRENLVAFLIILIITLIAINTILTKKDNEVDETKEEQSAFKVLADKGENNDKKYDDELEERLEKILETMVGVRQSKCINNLYSI